MSRYDSPKLFRDRNSAAATFEYDMVTGEKKMTLRYLNDRGGVEVLSVESESLFQRLLDELDMAKAPPSPPTEEEIRRRREREKAEAQERLQRQVLEVRLRYLGTAFTKVAEAMVDERNRNTWALMLNFARGIAEVAQDDAVQRYMLLELR